MTEHPLQSQSQIQNRDTTPTQSQKDLKSWTWDRERSRFKNKITDQEQKVVFTQKDMIFSVNSGSKLTEVNINYRISWWEALSRERNTNHENKGFIRLTARGIIIELLFSAKDSYKATKKF